MADTHDSIAGETGHGHHGPTLPLYLSVAAVLGVFTAVSFIVNDLVRHEMMSAMSGLVIILGVAVCKAALVGAFFMHLKYDWFKLYFMIVPVFILAVMMMLVLMPDIVVAWRH
jgi:cytochrome c oxidase subunit 4